MPRISLGNLDRITVQALSSFHRIGKVGEMLLDITADGVISEDERADMELVLENLEELERIAQSLKVWVKKNL